MFRGPCIVDPDKLMANVRGALARGLPEAKQCKPHKHVLSIAGGGPSLADTYKELDGYIGAVNGSAGYLAGKGILPDACLLLDPVPWLTDEVLADNRIRYFVASQCDPAMFDYLKDCHVELWHASGPPGLGETLQGKHMLVGGGSTCSLRWITLGYALGFRHFKLHGMDSSYGKGHHHAYGVKTDDLLPTMEIGGFITRSDFVAQVNDFMAMLIRMSQPDIEPIKIEVFGDGLLQHHWKNYQERHPGAFQ
jgi:hypothetical protein